MKLLICDDDISVIDLIQNQLNLGEIGVDRLLRAYNGLAAKELIKKEHPEMILCDIGMPQCNGIDVLKFVSEEHISAEFTFLTCYESFEYAREAVRYGAANYLTKPVDLNELRDALCAMAASARAKAMRKSENEDDRDVVVLNGILRRMRDGEFGTDREKIRQVLAKNRIRLQPDSAWYAVCAGVDVSPALNAGWKQDLIRFGFRFMMTEGVTGRTDSSLQITDSQGNYSIVTLLLEQSDVSLQDLDRRCHYIAGICRKNYGITPFFIISDPFVLSDFAKVGYPLRKLLMKYRMFSGSVNLFRAASEEAPVPAAPLLDEMELLKFIRLEDKNSILSAVSRAIESCSKHRESYDHQIHRLHHDLLQIFYGCLRDNHIPAHELFDSEDMQELDESAENSVFDMMNFVSRLYDNTISAIRAKNAHTDIVGRAKVYMEEHFRENIDRDEIAAIAYITPNYLSKRFHTEVGMSIREYINLLRINEAKRLLLTTDKSVSTIAMDIGFENISYFSTVFRKLTGLSPKEWKSGNAGGDAE